MYVCMFMFLLCKKNEITQIIIVWIRLTFTTTNSHLPFIFDSVRNAKLSVPWIFHCVPALWHNLRNAGGVCKPFWRPLSCVFADSETTGCTAVQGRKTAVHTRHSHTYHKAIVTQVASATDKHCSDRRRIGLHDVVNSWVTSQKLETWHTSISKCSSGVSLYSEVSRQRTVKRICILCLSPSGLEECPMLPPDSTGGHCRRSFLLRSLDVTKGVIGRWRILLTGNFLIQQRNHVAGWINMF
jgi:hypothetical protein